MTVHVAIHGAAGRMGQRLVALGTNTPGLKITAALESANHPRLGEDAGTVAGVGAIGVPLSAEPGEAPVDVVIDFSSPAGVDRILDLCVQRNIPLVLATTGLSPEQREKVTAATGKIALLWAPNMSLAVNLLMKLTGVAANALKDQASGVDVEIIERHHRFKEDAPSGTALKFGEIVAQAMGQQKHVHGREGQTGARMASEIGYHAVRVGDNPGEHTIIFGMLGESIELVVRASNRDCYAHGALAAAKFLASKPAGSYDMNDVLGL